MHHSVPMVEIWRGGHLESVHCGHAVVCEPSGQIIDAWGDPDQLIFPRSSCKMLQALPLVESGAAEAFGLTQAHLALACASHSGAAIHTDKVADWLVTLGLSESDFRCGPQWPSDIPAREDLTRSGARPCQIHNNCSGKHSGFLTLTKHIGGGAEYIDPEHPIQRMVKAAHDEMCGMEAPGFGIDGCSAPNFMTSVQGLAASMAKMAAPNLGAARDAAAKRLVSAMIEHAELVAGQGRACTELMRASDGRAAVKTGAEAVFVGILPDRKLGFAVKISDGGTRAAEASAAGLLMRYGALDPHHPVAKKWAHGPIRNRRNIVTGEMRFASSFLGDKR